MSSTLKAAGKAALTTLAITCASLAFVGGAQAQGRGGHGGGGGGGHSFHGGGGGWHGGGSHYAPRYGGGYRRGGNGWIWGGVGLGVGLGLASYYNSYPYYYSDPGYVVVEPPPVVYDTPQTVYSQPVPATSSQPVIYPRNGQSAARMDSDSRACSQWAGQQPNANDASVFQRATQACMDGRGYTVR